MNLFDTIAYYTIMALGKLNLTDVSKIAAMTGDVYDHGAHIADGVYIGSLSTATSKKFVHENNIEAIINLSCVEYSSDLPTLVIRMDDARVTPKNMDAYVRKFADGVREIIVCVGAGKRVLVHCAAGINRSATLIGMYLIERGYTYKQAVELIEAANAARGVPALTNETFKYLLQLRDSFLRNFNKK